MIKRLIIGIIFFIIGFGIAVFLDSFFRRKIQDLFLWTTNNRIQFNGKDLYLFGNPIYFISLGLAFLVFSIANRKNELKKVFRNGIFLILIFLTVLIGISALNANMKIIECTACENGIRKLGYSEINYGRILTLSALASIIPSLISIIRNRKKN